MQVEGLTNNSGELCIHHRLLRGVPVNPETPSREKRLTRKTNCDTGESNERR
jgi:hypothetical protein